MSLPPGRMLGPYEIISPIGAGGMGEVLKAKDKRLGRTVAVKVLPTHLSSDSERRGRFEREARAASALNHPNITTVYDIGEDKGTHYIVMELVEGKTFRELMDEAPLSPEKMLPLATQIAEGLSKAHAAGIVHRDLKPENLMVTEDGLVKILDFGLAKLMPETDVDSETPTLTRATQQGALMGTVQYMSPEQASNRPLDFRSDQFSFGSILYEMATGNLAFKKDTVPETLAAIIEEDPEPIRKVNEEIPVELAAVVERCMAKDPAGRYASTDDLAKELKTVPETPSLWRASRKLVWAAAGLLVAFLAMALGPNLIRLWDQISSRAGPSPIESIAVLPLQNLSGDPEQEYFADGMTEALITDLAKIGALKVISRSSAMRYKGTDKPLSEIANELNVDALVEGSAQRVGGSVRIMAQLIDPETEQALWAESYERELENVLLLWSEVAQAIAGEVAVTLTPEDTERLEAVRPVNPEAYDAYLKGTYPWDKLTREDLDTAENYFELALEKDPSYAAAYAGLSMVWGGRQQRGYATPHEAGPKRKATALQAIALDDTSAVVHENLARSMTWTDWDWASAEREWRRALEIDPNLASAHAFFAHFLGTVGRIDEAIPHSERAIELDPFNTLFHGLHAQVLCSAGRYDDAMAAARNAIAMQSDLLAGTAAGALECAFVSKGMRDEHLALQRERLARDPERLAALEQGFAEAGYEGAMRRVADLLAARYEKSGGAPDPAARTNIIATWYLFAGDYDRSIEWLERAFEVHDPGLPYVNFRPYWAPLRSNPRFQDLLRRMNLPLSTEQDG
jgi:serine/threonine protein kinase/tetratricopeptide (TPR) repeat protein